MRTARELLSQYAEYHRDRRNIATHFVGIPLIVFSVAVLLARVPLPGLDPRLSAATLMWVLTSGFYLSRHPLVGAATSLAVGLASDCSSARCSWSPRSCSRSASAPTSAVTSSTTPAPP